MRKKTLGGGGGGDLNTTDISRWIKVHKVFPLESNSCLLEQQENLAYFTTLTFQKALVNGCVGRVN